MGFPGGTVVKNLPVNAGDEGSASESGRSPGGGDDNPPSALAWRITWTEESGRVHGVTKNRTQVSEHATTTTNCTLKHG